MRPSVLFVCVKNGGKSQIAGALARHMAGGKVSIDTGGTKPGAVLNDEARLAVEEVGASFDGEYPKPITDPESYDRVIVIGKEAGLDGDNVETWLVDEPSLRGIEGMERMRIIRDEIADRVRELLKDLTR